MYEIVDALYIQVQGRIDPKKADSFMQDMMDKVESITQEIVVFDFRDLQGMNSRILGIIVKVWQSIKDQEKTVRVLARPHVAELLRISRLDSIVDIYLLDEKYNAQHS